MLSYLIERENEEMFRTSKRKIDFPDGVTRHIETYRLVWTWFDRVITSDDVPDETWILEAALQWSDEKGVSIADALGQLLNFIVSEVENNGADFTDDNLSLLVARQQMDKFKARKEKR